MSYSAILDSLPQLRTAVVLIYIDDALGRAAVEQLDRLWKLSALRGLTVFSTELNAETAPVLQAIRAPQYRLYRFGNEVGSIVGARSDDDLLDELLAFYRS